MRSRNEQQDLGESSGTRELQILSEVGDTPDVTQRELAKRIGIALGLTNVVLRNLAQRGYVQVTQSTWKRRFYSLTPEGLSRKILLTLSYVQRVLDRYQKIRRSLREELEPLALNKESRVAIFGTGEFAELVYLGLKDMEIEEIDIFAINVPADSKFLGMPVRDASTLIPDEFDRVVIALLQKPEAAWDLLLEQGIGPDKLVTFFSDGRAREMV